MAAPRAHCPARERLASRSARNGRSGCAGLQRFPNPRFVERINEMTETRREGGAEDPTETRRSGGDDGASYLLPTVIRCDLPIIHWLTPNSAPLFPPSARRKS